MHVTICGLFLFYFTITVILVKIQVLYFIGYVYGLGKDIITLRLLKSFSLFVDWKHIYSVITHLFV